MNTVLFGGATISSVLFALWCVYSLCRGVVPFSKKAKEVKRRKAVLTKARKFVLSYEDLPAYSAGGEHGEAMQSLRAAWKARDAEKCFKLLTELNPPQSWAACRKWLDSLVVQISVTMAFMAYFYEPTHIPTGSMQPTLYGNHSTTCKPEDATAWDKTPGLRWYKWLVTGKMYECYWAPFNGTLRFKGMRDTGFYDMRVFSEVEGASRSMLVPTDVKLPSGLHDGSVVRQGDLLWSGYVHSGDFILVNRWLWNFRRPRRGDMMAFTTTGIPKLQQGMRYGKRMTGLPGEKLSIVAAGEKDGQAAFELRVNGEKPMTPRRIAQIQNHEKWHEKAYPYAGYRPSGDSRYDEPGRTICHVGDEVTLGPDEFYACGDNSINSFDSRYWGPVPAKNLVGIAGGVFWPFATHRWGPIE